MQRLLPSLLQIFSLACTNASKRRRQKISCLYFIIRKTPKFIVKKSIVHLLFFA